MRYARLGILVLTTACSSARPGVRVVSGPPAAGVDSSAVRAIEPIVNHRSFRSAFWGILVVDVEHGDTIYARNPSKLLVPASNLKVVTGAVALKTLGPDFRFTTVIAATGPIRQGVLRGDLVVLGSGDPTFSDRFQTDGMAPLRVIADSLYRRGVRRISGRLASGLDAFPDASLGQGWAWDDLDEAYAAGVDELLLNEGIATVTVRGGSGAGQPVEVQTSPARTFPRARVTARTVVGGKPAIWITQDSSGSADIVVAGSIPTRGTVTLEVTNRNQTEAFLLALKEALANRGIKIDGAVVERPLGGTSSGLGSGPSAEVRARPRAGPGRTVLFSITSQPLAQILKPFLKNSVNPIGEALFKTLGRLRTGSGTYATGADAISRQLRAWGASPDGFIIHDGSGLSRLDAVSAETFVRVLTGIRRDTAFAAFSAALPVAGVDGTLGKRLGGRPARGNVHAKTGSMDHVRALSGYVTTADGRELAFSILCNNWTVDATQVENAIDEIVLRLARLRRSTR